MNIQIKLSSAGFRRLSQGFFCRAVDCLLRDGEEEIVNYFVIKCGVLQEIREIYMVNIDPSLGRDYYNY